MEKRWPLLHFITRVEALTVIFLAYNPCLLVIIWKSVIAAVSSPRYICDHLVWFNVMIFIFLKKMSKKNPTNTAFFSSVLYKDMHGKISFLVIRKGTFILVLNFLSIFDFNLAIQLKVWLQTQHFKSPSEVAPQSKILVSEY